MISEKRGCTPRIIPVAASPVFFDCPVKVFTRLLFHYPYGFDFYLHVLVMNPVFGQPVLKVIKAQLPWQQSVFAVSLFIGSLYELLA